ncbi:MAG: hypothetical protein Tsb002_29610 [Wenzhouxiangellaceae bacterium]
MNTPSASEHHSGNKISALWRLLRPYQWSKNLLVFIPLFMAHRWQDVAAAVALLKVFVAFSLASSAIYVINDALDVDSDRQHPVKRQRPFASGDLPISLAPWLAPALILAAALMTQSLPLAAQWTVAAYVVLALLYCLVLKPLLWLDVIALAALYTLRVLAGAAAIAVIVSPWLAGFSMFMFFGLAAVKRYSELRATGAVSLSGRGYTAGDALPVITLGSGASLLSVLVLALYLNSDDVHQLYRQPQWLWLIGPTLLYWQARLWTFAHRGQIQRDPLSFSLRDLNSWAALTLCVLFFRLAL